MIDKHVRGSAMLLFTFCIITSLGFSQSIDERIQEFETRLMSLRNRKIILQTQLNELKLEKIRQDLLKVGLPKVQDLEKVIVHSGFSLVYSEQHEQAKWVSHIIVPEIVDRSVNQMNSFREDPLIDSRSAIHLDYVDRGLKPGAIGYEYDSFGFDRKQMAPKEDFKWNEKALYESYYYSNVSPQTTGFNNGKWLEMESLLRRYIEQNSTTQLYVTTGPILNDSLPFIEEGVNKVSIPEHFFKVVLDLKNRKSIAFLIPSNAKDSSLSNYVLSINEMEEKTGLDFFYKLNDELEEEIESQNNLSGWIFEQLLPVNSDQSIDSSFLNKIYSTDSIKQFIGSNQELKVRGKVVKNRRTGNGSLIFSLEKLSPNHFFNVYIKKDDMFYFSYDPLTEWEDKELTVSGKIVRLRGVPTMFLESEDSVRYE